MDQIKKLYEKTKQSLLHTNKNNTDKGIEIIKQIQNKIKVLRQQNPTRKKQLDSLQVICLNNLACAYNRKGKFKASLYNLELATQLQCEIYKNLQQLKDPQSLHQVATTHSNICAVLSQMNDHQKAYKQISKAIELLLRTNETKSSDALVVFYFNCAVELEYLNKLNEALKVARKGLTLSATANREMEDKFVQLVDKLQQKIKKRQKKVAKIMMNSLRIRNKSTSDQRQLKKRGNSLNLIIRQKQSPQNHQGYDMSKQLPAFFSRKGRNASKSVKKTQYPDVKLPSFYNNNTSNIQYSNMNNTLRFEQQKNVLSIYQPRNKNRISYRTQKFYASKKQIQKERSLEKIVLQDLI